MMEQGVSIVHKDHFGIKILILVWPVQKVQFTMKKLNNVKYNVFNAQLTAYLTNKQENVTALELLLIGMANIVLLVILLNIGIR